MHKYTTWHGAFARASAGQGPWSINAIHWTTGNPPLRGSVWIGSPVIGAMCICGSRPFQLLDWLPPKGRCSPSLCPAPWPSHTGCGWCSANWKWAGAIYYPAAIWRNCWRSTSWSPTQSGSAQGCRTPHKSGSSRRNTCPGIRSTGAASQTLRSTQGMSTNQLMLKTYLVALPPISCKAQCWLLITCC